MRSLVARVRPVWLLWLAVLWVLPAPACSQELRDSVVVSPMLRPEFGMAVGAAFPQGDFTRDVSTGLILYGRFSYPIRTKNGLSILASGGAVDFSSENQGAIIDTTGTVTSASQELDYQSAFAHLGFQWTGSWETFALRPRLGISAGPHWVETRSTVTVSGAQVDSLAQTSTQATPGLRLFVASDWVLRNNVGLTIEFQIDNVFKVAQYEVSDGVTPATVVEKSVSYVSFLAGLVFPL